MTSSVSMLAEAGDYARQIGEADTLDKLKAVLASWSPYVPDAMAIVEDMDAASFADFRRGLAKERSRQFAGPDFAKRFGAVLLPAVLLDASLAAQKYFVPLGVALRQIGDQLLSNHRERQRKRKQ